MKHPTLAVLAALAVLMPVGARAALPSWAMLSIEMQAILIDWNIYKNFPRLRPIISIRAVEPIDSHVYEIKSPECTAMVTVVPKPWKGMGPGSNPTDYVAKLGQVQCRLPKHPG